VLIEADAVRVVKVGWAFLGFRPGPDELVGRVRVAYEHGGPEVAVVGAFDLGTDMNFVGFGGLCGGGVKASGIDCAQLLVAAGDVVDRPFDLFG
jgi:hypothetical protein